MYKRVMAKSRFTLMIVPICIFAVGSPSYAGPLGGKNSESAEQGDKAKVKKPIEFKMTNIEALDAPFIELGQLQDTILEITADVQNLKANLATTALELNIQPGAKVGEIISAMLFSDLPELKARAVETKATADNISKRALGLKDQIGAIAEAVKELPATVPESSKAALEAKKIKALDVPRLPMVVAKNIGQIPKLVSSLTGLVNELAPSKKTKDEK